MPDGLKRMSRKFTLAMPARLRREHCKEVANWPIAPNRIAQARSLGWIDVVIYFVDQVRTGNKYNCRRVHYDGSFYVMWRGERVYLEGMLTLDVFETCTEVYSTKDEAKRLERVRNKKALERYKGY